LSLSVAAAQAVFAPAGIALVVLPRKLQNLYEGSLNKNSFHPIKHERIFSRLPIITSEVLDFGAETRRGAKSHEVSPRTREDDFVRNSSMNFQESKG